MDQQPVSTYLSQWQVHTFVLGQGLGLFALLVLLGWATQCEAYSPDSYAAPNKMEITITSLWNHLSTEADCFEIIFSIMYLCNNVLNHFSCSWTALRRSRNGGHTIVNSRNIWCWEANMYSNTHYKCNAVIQDTFSQEWVWMTTTVNAVTILELKTDTTSVLYIIDVFSITANNKSNQWLGNLNLYTTMNGKHLTRFSAVFCLGSPNIPFPSKFWLFSSRWCTVITYTVLIWPFLSL